MPREAGPRAGEYLAAAGIQTFWTDPRHPLILTGARVVRNEDVCVAGFPAVVGTVERAAAGRDGSAGTMVG
ncbi:hypothetical protein GCM10023223_00730 [Stackebrandtia albiflava]